MVQTVQVQPPMKIRPSKAQFTAIKELFANRQFYVDFGLLKAHSIRTARGERWKDWIDAGGVPHRLEVHGPPNIKEWLESWRIFECTCIMLNVAIPPRLEAYATMFEELVEQYPESYAYAYQQEDRLRHEIVPELLRTETVKYDRRLLSGWAPGTFDEDSYLNPDHPWDHILYLMVHGSEMKDYWRDNFLRHGAAVRAKVAKLGSELTGEAPIASAPSALHDRPRTNAATTQPTRPPTVPRDVGRHPWSKPNADRSGAKTWDGVPRTHSGPASGRFEICNLYNKNQCNGTIRDGACGKSTCPNTDRIHACNLCGATGHPATDCPHRSYGTSQKEKRNNRGTPKGGNRKGKGSKGGKGKGKGGKG